jgi:hypothetical protein
MGDAFRPPSLAPFGVVTEAASIRERERDIDRQNTGGSGGCAELATVSQKARALKLPRHILQGFSNGFMLKEAVRVRNLAFWLCPNITHTTTMLLQRQRQPTGTRSDPTVSRLLSVIGTKFGERIGKAAYHIVHAILPRKISNQVHLWANISVL